VERERLRQLKRRQGQVLDLKVIEVEAASKRLIFSERATEVAAAERKQLLQALEPGQVRSGVVTNLADFGAFVDLGGVEGLIHISQLSWRRLVHPGDVVRPGQMLDVLVMEVDEERERVALSRKQLRPDPWIGVEERYEPEQIVKGAVTNVADFGAFVLVEEGLEGLIHVSEMGQEPDLQLLQVVQEGQMVKVRVLHVSEQKRRLALSLCL
jgi:small subunit ribosomal protein S1